MKEQILIEVERILKDTETFFLRGGEVLASDCWVQLNVDFDKDLEAHNLGISLNYYGDIKTLAITITHKSRITFNLDNKEFTKFKYLSDNLTDLASQNSISILKLL